MDVVALVDRPRRDRSWANSIAVRRRGRSCGRGADLRRSAFHARAVEHAGQLRRRLARAGVLRRLPDALASVVCRGGRRNPPRDPGRLLCSLRRWPARRSPSSTSLSGWVSRSSPARCSGWPAAPGAVTGAGFESWAWRCSAASLRPKGCTSSSSSATCGLAGPWSWQASLAVVVLSSRGDRLLTLAVSPLPIAAAALVYAAINWLGTFNSL